MFIVLKHVDGRDCGVDADGTVQRDLNEAELFSSASAAQAVADNHGGAVHDDERVLAEDW